MAHAWDANAQVSIAEAEGAAVTRNLVISYGSFLSKGKTAIPLPPGTWTVRLRERLRSTHSIPSDGERIWLDYVEGGEIKAFLELDVYSNNNQNWSSGQVCRPELLIRARNPSALSGGCSSILIQRWMGADSERQVKTRQAWQAAGLRWLPYSVVLRGLIDHRGSIVVYYWLRLPFPDSQSARLQDIRDRAQHDRALSQDEQALSVWLRDYPSLLENAITREKSAVDRTILANAPSSLLSRVIAGSPGKDRGATQQSSAHSSPAQRQFPTNATEPPALPGCPPGARTPWHACVGTFTLPSGERYVGEYQNDRRHGEGIEYRPDGSVNLSGLWANNGIAKTYPIDPKRFPFPEGAKVAEEAQDASRTRQEGGLQRLDETRERDQEHARAEAERKRIEEEARQLAESKMQDRLAAEARERDRLVSEARELERQAALVRARERADLEAKDRERLAAELREMREQLSRRDEAAKQREDELQRQLADARSAAARLIAPKSGRHALVIGIDQYQSIPRLKNAVADAREVASALRGFGYAVREHKDLAGAGFRRAMRDFRTQIAAGDEVVVFYAGHGVQIGGLNYFLPSDTRGESEAEVRDEAVQL